MSATLFVLDISSEQGTGHLYRCTTLALCLAQAGVHSVIAYRGQESYVRKLGLIDRFPTVRIPADSSTREEIAELSNIAKRFAATVSVIDHYRADPAYQTLLATLGMPWMQFDNSASFGLRAHWIVNINPSASKDAYSNICAPDSHLLLGPAYAVLRPEFQKARKAYVPAPIISRSLIFLGGGNVLTPLRRLLYLLLPAFPNIAFHVVASGSFSQQLQEFRHFSNFIWVGEVSEFSRTLKMMDLAIVSAGTSSYECACVGVPFVTIEVAVNQAPIAAAWASLGIAPRLGRWELIEKQAVCATLTEALPLADRNWRSEHGRSLVDGQGALRLCSHIREGV